MIGFNKSLNETNGRNDSTDTQRDKKEPELLLFGMALWMWGDFR